MRRFRLGPDDEHYIKTNVAALYKESAQVEREESWRPKPRTNKKPYTIKICVERGGGRAVPGVQPHRVSLRGESWGPPFCNCSSFVKALQSGNGIEADTLILASHACRKLWGSISSPCGVADSLSQSSWLLVSEAVGAICHRQEGDSSRISHKDCNYMHKWLYIARLLCISVMITLCLHAHTCARTHVHARRESILLGQNTEFLTMTCTSITACLVAVFANNFRAVVHLLSSCNNSVCCCLTKPPPCWLEMLQIEESAQLLYLQMQIENNRKAASSDL
ncbi:hypothetical protein Anapl_00292 [Anas platyrhynchos]|uniref:Uncharacterized protein n=1 Tax=Anas platyrhynchos TaxID=8839 RepID=R0KCC8_ANAPL|nr:hypothetical protein Anapl_00292 [Anas platyrhynchos]